MDAETRVRFDVPILRLPVLGMWAAVVTALDIAAHIGAALSTFRVCVTCSRPIMPRYAFDTCTPCAIHALQTSPEVIAWRAEKRAAAYERLASAGLVKKVTNAAGDVTQ